MIPPDPREAPLLDAAMTFCAETFARYSQAGYPAWLAYKEAAAITRYTLGVRLALVEPPITTEMMLWSARDLSPQWNLEHDGSALNTLLARFDYQWPMADGTWQLTARSFEEQLGFSAPYTTPRILWKPAVVRQVMTLEQARQALEPLAPGEPQLLQRHYRSPRELGLSLGISTRAVNIRLREAGLHTWEPHLQAHRWQPTPQARQEHWCIYGVRGLEWLPRVCEVHEE